MKEAFYGRMRIGKCVNHDMGYLGCETDILNILDGKCSNKQFCDFVVVLELNFDQGIANPCKDLARYLEADYSCTKSTNKNMYML